MRQRSPFLVAVSALALLAGPAADAAPSDRVSFSFDSGKLSLGEVQRGAVSTGTATVIARMVTVDGGNAVRVKGRKRGYAVRFPAASTSSQPPRAVLRVSNDGDSDQLSPHAAGFTIGADVKLRAVSDGNATDNGDNVVQRGLYDDAAQYKLQLDGRTPACRVKGDAGELFVQSPVRVNATDWYRITCTRESTSLTLRVIWFRDGREPATTTTTGTGLTGQVQMARTVPLAVGGKLDAAGHLVSSTDQFNGVIDRVFLNVAN